MKIALAISLCDRWDILAKTLPANCLALGDMLAGVSIAWTGEDASKIDYSCLPKHVPVSLRPVGRNRGKQLGAIDGVNAAIAGAEATLDKYAWILAVRYDIEVRNPARLRDVVTLADTNEVGCVVRHCVRSDSCSTPDCYMADCFLAWSESIVRIPDHDTCIELGLGGQLAKLPKGDWLEVLPEANAHGPIDAFGCFHLTGHHSGD